MYFDQSTKIYVAGHRGLAGSAICRELNSQGYQNLITKTHQELDLEDQKITEEFISDIKPDVVILAAAKVGGILANNEYPVDFLMRNLAIQSNVIKSAFKAQVKRLLFLGSSCIYPKNCPQPIREEYLFTSELESTNRPYAIAKIAGIEMCWSYNRQFNTKYLAAMPTNLYGPDDNYDLDNSHVLPALIRKFHQAKINNIPTVEVWGTGLPKREFLYSEDLAKGIIHLINLNYDDFKNLTKPNICPIINIGTGEDITIKELATKIKKIVQYNGEIFFNTRKPDGTPRKLLKVNKIKSLGWTHTIDLDVGINNIYNDFKSKKL